MDVSVWVRFVFHLIAIASGVIYYLVQGGKPKPRLQFDVLWSIVVVMTGYWVMTGSPALWVWIPGMVLAVGGFFYIFPALSLVSMRSPNMELMIKLQLPLENSS